MTVQEIDTRGETPKSLSGKVVLLTGAAQGLGKVAAVYLATRGATIAALDRQGVSATVAAVEEVGGRCLALQADVSCADDVDAAFAAASAEFGRIDALVNGAALFTTLKQQSFLEIDPDEWDHVYSVNVKGVFLCSRAAGRQMMTQKFGSIINVASNVFSYGMGNFLHYVSSKASVVGITRGVARELGPYGIRVNAISPGLVSTDIISGTRSAAYIDGVVATQCIPEPIMPSDIAAVMAFLASDDSRLITGQTLLVNAGSHMGPA